MKSKIKKIRKSVKAFIEEHRQELCSVILGSNGMKTFRHKLDDNDIHTHILSDEGLYNWARREGVRI
jgi:hypothetical protein